jgi:hypothetical protein
MTTFAKNLRRFTLIPGSVVVAASARLCLQNEGTGAIGPCRTISVKIA